MVKAIGVKEGDRVLLKVLGDSIVIEILRDPIELSLFG
ncbi:MAG: AbrB/MazE/SpoVT family DNA-binding domain-containing protein, partial [Candidatus Brockarchaeota archaeon]|nr:AbrB/MazE/SpoVT family DNA-binding domain-containing protein [Candidatus Brockarchaeota archaeon]